MDNENKSLAQKMSEADLPPHYRVYAAMGAIQGILEINGIECKGSAPEDVYEAVKGVVDQLGPCEEGPVALDLPPRIHTGAEAVAFDDLAYLRLVPHEVRAQWGVMLRGSEYWQLLPGAQVHAMGKVWTYTPSGWVTHSMGNDTQTVTWGCLKHDSHDEYLPMVNYAGAAGHLLHLLRKRHKDNYITTVMVDDMRWAVDVGEKGYYGNYEVEALILALTDG